MDRVGMPSVLDKDLTASDERPAKVESWIKSGELPAAFISSSLAQTWEKASRYFKGQGIKKIGGEMAVR